MVERVKGKVIATWMLAGLLAALYLFSGGSKLAGAEMHVQGFAQWGYPQWFRLVVGAVEVTLAILLLIPRAAFFGASALMVVMAGATYTHLFRATGEGSNAVATVVLLGLAGLVAYARRAEALAVARRRSSSARREEKKHERAGTAFASRVGLDTKASCVAPPIPGAGSLA